MKQFCTYITFYRGNKLPPFYIGSTSIKKINGGYRGSVTSKQYKNIWQNELKINPHLFKTVIISTHKTREGAGGVESKLQKYLRVHKNPLYINKSYWGGGHLNYSKKCSSKTKEKISMSLKGRKAWNKGIKTGPLTEKTKKKLSDSRKAHFLQNPTTEKTKKKLSDSRKAHFLQNPTTKKKLSNSKSKNWIVITPNQTLVNVFNLKQWCVKNFDNHRSAYTCLSTRGIYKKFICKKKIIY